MIVPPVKGERRGGRKKGTPNKAPAAQMAAIAASGLTPLEYMLRILRDEKAEPDARFEAAKAAAPYCHAKLTAVDNKHSFTEDFSEWLGNRG